MGSCARGAAKPAIQSTNPSGGRLISRMASFWDVHLMYSYAPPVLMNRGLSAVL
jgi:hypothetical protein